MSQENVEVVRALFDAAARRDSATVLALYDPDVEWDNTRGPMQGLVEGKVYRGYEGLRQWWREFREPWESVWGEVEELIDATRLPRSGCCDVRGSPSGPSRVAMMSS